MEGLTFSVGDVISIATVIAFFVMFRIENKHGQTEIKKVLASIQDRDAIVDERARDWQRHQDKALLTLESMKHTLESLSRTQEALFHTQEKITEGIYSFVKENAEGHAKVVTMLATLLKGEHVSERELL